MSRPDDASVEELARQREQLGRPWAVRALLFVYTGFAILAATYFSSGPRRDFVQSASIAYFILAGAASLILGLLMSRGYPLRRVIIGFEGLLVPSQVAISVRSD